MPLFPSSEHREVEILNRIYEKLCDIEKTLERNNSEVISALKAQTVLLQQIADQGAPEPLTASVANLFTGDLVMADNALVFNVGQTSTMTITPRLADGATPSGGVLSNVVITFADPSATFVLNADNTVTWTGVAASTGAVSGSTACTVTDTDSVVSTWNVAFTITTNGVVPPQQLTQSVANVFSTPTP